MRRRPGEHGAPIELSVDGAVNPFRPTGEDRERVMPVERADEDGPNSVDGLRDLHGSIPSDAPTQTKAYPDDPGEDETEVRDFDEPDSFGQPLPLISNVRIGVLPDWIEWDSTRSPRRVASATMSTNRSAVK